MARRRRSGRSGRSARLTRACARERASARASVAGAPNAGPRRSGLRLSCDDPHVARREPPLLLPAVRRGGGGGGSTRKLFVAREHKTDTQPHANLCPSCDASADASVLTRTCVPRHSPPMFGRTHSMVARGSPPPQQQRLRVRPRSAALASSPKQQPPSPGTPTRRAGVPARHSSLAADTGLFEMRRTLLSARRDHLDAAVASAKAGMPEPRKELRVRVSPSAAAGAMQRSPSARRAAKMASGAAADPLGGRRASSARGARLGAEDGLPGQTARSNGSRLAGRLARAGSGKRGNSGMPAGSSRVGRTGEVGEAFEAPWMAPRSAAATAGSGGRPSSAARRQAAGDVLGLGAASPHASSPPAVFTSASQVREWTLGMQKDAASRMLESTADDWAGLGEWGAGHSPRGRGGGGALDSPRSAGDSSATSPRRSLDLLALRAASRGFPATPRSPPPRPASAAPTRSTERSANANDRRLTSAGSSRRARHAAQARTLSAASID